MYHGRGAMPRNLLMCQFTMVSTMDTTMPPKLIIVHTKVKTYYDLSFDEVE
jgi:hypothetical protein